MSVLAWIVWASIVVPERDPDVVRGETAYREERWSDASEAFAAAYARTGDPTYLYTQAQAERRAGRCEVAIDLYERFLDTEPADVAAATARGYVAECREQLGVSTETEPRPEPIAAPEPAVAPPIQKQQQRPWWKDPWGGAFVGVGTASLATGAVLVGLAHRGADGAPDATDDRGYGDRLARAETFQIAGATVMSVGAALVVGGVVRWVVLARRGRDTTARLTAAPTLGGLTVSGRLPSLATRGR